MVEPPSVSPARKQNLHPERWQATEKEDRTQTCGDWRVLHNTKCPTKQMCRGCMYVVRNQGRRGIKNRC